MDESALLTIAEAAARIGMTERGLRRLLTRPEYAVRVRTLERGTRTGTRNSAALPPDLIADLLERKHRQFPDEDKLRDATRKEADSVPDSNAAERGTRRGDVPDSEPESQQQESGLSLRTVAASYEIALRAKDELLEEKNARIGELTAALAHEREQSRRLTDVLSREQMLRSLPAPAETPIQSEAAPAEGVPAAAEHYDEGAEQAKTLECPPEAPGCPESAPTTPLVSLDMQKPVPVPEWHVGPKRLTFWERIWKRY